MTAPSSPSPTPKAASVPAEQPKLVDVVTARKIAAIDADVLTAITRLSSLGFTPAKMLPYCSKVAEGEDPGEAPVAGGPRELVIQAYSFLSDPAVHNGKYGMSLARAAELRAGIRSDPELAQREVMEAVSAYLRRVGSPRPVKITLDGLPAPPGAGSGSGGSKAPELSELSRRHQALVGQYKFVASETGPVGADHYTVLLGGNLACAARNKATAEKAAKLVRVLGRHHEVLLPYIRLYVPGKGYRGSDRIPKSVYSGILAPGSPLPTDELGGKDSTAG